MSDKLYKFKAWTGPTAAPQVREKLELAGAAIPQLDEIREGTEHIYVHVTAPSREGADAIISGLTAQTKQTWLEWKEYSRERGNHV